MSAYRKITVLLLAAKEAHEANEISDAQYLKILDDVDNDLVDADKIVLANDAKSVVLELYGST